MCAINNHVVTAKGLPVALPSSGTVCDCGKTIVQYLADGTRIQQTSPTGRLLGR